MAGAARAVRIRREADASLSASTTRAVQGAGQRYRNPAGSSRALRTFLLFLVALAVIYGVFMGFAVTSAAAGTNSAIEVVLTLSVAVALVIGWWVTLGQAPTTAYVEAGELVVRERTGRTRRFPIDGLRVTMLRSNDAGFLGSDPTEFVQLSAPHGPRRTYLVGTHFFDFAH
jgi:hypothetical protein